MAKNNGSIPVHHRDRTNKRKLVIPGLVRRGERDAVVNRHTPRFEDRAKYSRKRQNNKED